MGIQKTNALYIQLSAYRLHIVSLSYS